MSPCTLYIIWYSGFFSLQENVKERETKQIVEKERLVGLHLIKLDRVEKQLLQYNAKRMNLEYLNRVK